MNRWAGMGGRALSLRRVLGGVGRVVGFVGLNIFVLNFRLCCKRSWVREIECVVIGGT
jgi:hypothetical protein